MSIEYATHLRCIIPALFLAAACASGNPDQTPEPAPDGAGACAEDNPPERCGASCTSDGDCGRGLHCNDDRVCTAACTPSGGECDEGEICSDQGRCVYAPPPGDPGTGGGSCPSVDVGLTATTPTVVFLLDRSGSMGEERFGGLRRWNAVAQALVGEPGGVITQLAGRVVFGAAAYNNDVRGTCPDMVEVPAALDNRAAIGALMADHRPGGATPTGDALRALLDTLQASPPDPASPTIIILATDGEPDTCADPTPRYPDEIEAARTAAVDGARAAFDMGYRTYVLSVGADIATAHLQDMANAGAGLPLDTPDDAKFFVANDQAELVAALVGIINGERSCEVAVDGGTVETSRAGEGKVILNGTELAYETGWTVSEDGTHIVLVGDTCESFLQTPSVELSASFPCGVIIE